MEADYLLVADAAEAINGKHYVHGGGFDTIMAITTPVAHPRLGIAARLVIGWNETNQPFEVKLDVLDADMNSILPEAIRGNVSAGRPVTAEQGDDQAVPLAFNLVGLMFPKFGDYAIVLSVGGVEKRRAQFHVRPLAPGMGGLPVPQVPPA